MKDLTLSNQRVPLYKSENNKQCKLYSSTRISEMLKFRPEQEELDDFESYLRNFWDLFCDVFPGMRDYLSASDNQTAACKYRNKNDGGLLYFRPIALPKLVKAICETCYRTHSDLRICMQGFAKIDMVISNNIWANILWDNRKKTMMASNKSLISSMLIYLYNEDVLTAKELGSFKKSYAKAIGLDMHSADEKLVLLK